MSDLKLLVISGSLRKKSYNTAAISALKTLAPSTVKISVGKMSNLPLFNPDRENEAIPALDNLRLHLNQSSGLIIASAGLACKRRRVSEQTNYAY